MRTTLLLLFYPLLTAAYNLHVYNDTTYKAPSLNKEPSQTGGSFFGYSVLLSSRNRMLSNGTSVRESWLFVGAPKANYAIQPGHMNNKIPNEPGVTYRCQLPHKCVPINITNPDDEAGFIDQVRLNTLIEKGHGWFGAAMSLYEPTDSLTVCAPRTIVKMYGPSVIDYENTMQGICYTGNLYSGSLHIVDKNFTTHNFFSHFWYNPVNGFAVHYPEPQVDMQADSVDPIIGSPKHEFFGTVSKMGQHTKVELPIGDDVSQFGYALTSGYYFHRELLMIAGGAPGWQYVGQVAVMEPRTDQLNVIVKVNGKEIGEFFGASLATGDMNNDGLDDLIVGAPHWNNDNGRAHIFLGNKYGFFEADILLEGTVDDALYGYAMTSGDLDGDGFDDLIIGAPWENSGVIYVYNGNAKLQDLNSLEPSQTIAASDIGKDIRSFGFSFSKPRDIDGNNLSDIAVGAYASGHAVVLRSKPAVKTRMKLSTYPKILLRNSTSFVLIVCVSHFPHDTVKNQMWDSEVHFTVDEDYARFTSILGTFVFVRKAPITCMNKTISLKNDIRNYVDVIQIVAKHEFYYYPRFDECARNTTMGSLCPVEYKRHNATAQTTLSFDIGCGMDDICHASIFTTLDFQGIRNSTWMIGSNNLSLVLRIGNRAEPAYLTTVTFEIPKGIYLRSILPSCQEQGDQEELTVKCDIGNPLETAMEKVISLDFDMRAMHNGSADGTMLTFAVKIETLSVNGGDSGIAIPLHLKANVLVALSGKAHDKRYYFKHNEKPENFTFQHTYQISRSGSTSISVSYLTIQIPYKLNGLEFLSIAEKPRVSVLGHVNECTVVGVSVTPQHSVDESQIKTEIDDGFHLDTITSHSRSRRAVSQDDLTSVPRTDTISHTIRTNSTVWENKSNNQTQFYPMLESDDVDITYLNCSMPDITCGQVVCTIPSLKTSQDVGKIQLQLLFNDSILTGDVDEKVKVIYISTQASVEVIDPKMQFTIPGAGIIVPVTTTIYHATYVRNGISIWIILGSVLLGLLALCLIAYALWKIGFFKRNKKEELDNLKKCEDLLMRSNSLSEE